MKGRVRARLRRRHALLSALAAGLLLIPGLASAETAPPIGDIHRPFSVRTTDAEARQLQAESAPGLHAALAGAAGPQRLEVPLPTGEAALLELERFDVVAPDARFVIAGPGGGADLPPSDVLLYRGRIAGDEYSSAFLAVSGSGMINGFIDAAGTRYLLATPSASLKSGDRTVTIREAAGIGELEVPFCGTEPGSAFDDDLEMVKEAALKTSAGPKLLYLAIDADQAYVNMFGSAVEARDYIVQLAGAASAIYVRDLDLRLWLRFARLWPSGGEPFSPQDLYGFRDYWQVNEDPSPFNIIHMFSGRRDTPYGGVSFISNTCNGNAYGIDALLNGSFTAPVTYPDNGNWDINVFPHEMGHNCGTYHTHDDQYNPHIDDCGNGTPSVSTMMSYCHTFQGYQRNIDLRFHRRVVGIIRSVTYAAGCHGFDCNGNGVPDDADIAAGSSLDVNSDGIRDECQDCNGNGTLDPLEIAGGAPDVDGNGILDACEADCNSNGLPDRYETWALLAADADGNFRPDACDPDCDNNGQLDYSQIQANLALDLDRNRVLDQCQDCNGNFVPDWMDMGRQFNVFTGDRVLTGIAEFHEASGVTVGSYPSVATANDVLADPAGSYMWVAATDGQVYRHAVGSGTLSVFIAAGSGGLGQPSGLLIPPSGELLVLDLTNAAVRRYNRSTGAFLGNLVAPGGGGVTQPRGMVFSPDGASLLVNSSDNGVYRFLAATGASLGLFVSPGSGGLSGPRGMAFLPNGNLVVSSYNTNQVLEYDGTTGAFVREFTDEFGLSLPWGLRIGPNGHLFIGAEGAVFEYFPDLGKYYRRFVRGTSAVDQVSGLDFLPASPHDVNGNRVLDVCEAGDLDGDGVPNVNDNCPTHPNPAQTDGDGDGAGDACDNCLATVNPDQRDVDNDTHGDLCDDCPAEYDPAQADSDGDGRGDACDNCPALANADQADDDFDFVGNLCDLCPNDPINDPDGDDLCASVDNCPLNYNPGQEDLNGNGVGDACELLVYDTVATQSTQLIIGSTGNFAREGTGGATLDYYDAGDCEWIYLYDGSPVIAYQSGPATIAASSLYGDNGFKNDPAGKLSVPTIDSGAFQVFRSANVTTADGTIGLQKIWYAPRQPDTAQFVIQRLRVYSADGAVHTGVAIGEFMDWDIPGSGNAGGIDAVCNLIYLQGSGSGCEDNSLRQGGVALLGTVVDSLCIDPAAVPYGAITQANSVYIYPTGNLVPSEVWTLMQQPGYSALTSYTDQFILMTYYNAASVAPGDTIDIYSVLATTLGSAPRTLPVVVDQARVWFAGHVGCYQGGGCCVLRGDFNDDGSVKVSDLTGLVNYLFRGGPAPACLDHGDTNGDGSIKVSDLTLLINYLFRGGPPPVACP